MNTQAIQEEKAMKSKFKFQRMVLPLLLLGIPLAVQGEECVSPCTITGNIPSLIWSDTDSGTNDWQARLDPNLFFIGETIGNGLKPFKIERPTVSNLLVLDSAANIGINTSVPGVTLDVVGDGIRLREGSLTLTKVLTMSLAGQDVELRSNNADLFIRSEIDSITEKHIIMNPFADDGNVVIGTTTPDDDFKLHVEGNIKAAFSGFTGGPADDGLVSLVTLESLNTNAAKSSDVGFALKNAKESFQWNFRTFEGSQGFVATKQGTGGPEMEVRNDTNDYRSVSIAMGNDAQLTPFGVWQDASSRAHKESIEPITLDEAMDALNQLNPVKYRFKRDPDKELTLGFIAEDVPELVAAKGRKNMSSMEVVATLTKVVQNQQKVIQKQQKAAEEQKNLTMELSAKLAELDKIVKSNAMVAMQ